MNFFESLLLLMAIAIVLLQLTRRSSIPYPTMLAAAGVALALIPGTPRIGLDPQTALALFIAPALVDAAFDFPVVAARRYWRPLFALAVMAVILTAACVAVFGVVVGGLPIYAALALGAIVAPPDAAAATAVLNAVRMPRRAVVVLKGESLLNDATALMLFTAAVSMHESGGHQSTVAVHLLLAAPAGALIGIGAALLLRRALPAVAGTMSGNLLEFVASIGLWIIAERLHLSAVLCLVAFAMTIARYSEQRTPPRMRIQSFALWGTAVFLLNVFAFLLMGAQAAMIIGQMEAERLLDAASFAAAVVTIVILVRIGWVILYNRLAARYPVVRGDLAPTSIRNGVLVGWTGMRGLVTLATAFALPASFPERDLLVLSAFAVVLATLIIQGATLAPLVRLLGLDGDNGASQELGQARADLSVVGLAILGSETDGAADYWRYELEATRRATLSPREDGAHVRLRQIGLDIIAKQRERLREMRNAELIGTDTHLVLQEELDFREVTLTEDDKRQIAES